MLGSKRRHGKGLMPGRGPVKLTYTDQRVPRAAPLKLRVRVASGGPFGTMTVRTAVTGQQRQIGEQGFRAVAMAQSIRSPRHHLAIC